MNAILQWLELLYGQEPAGLIWVGGHGDGFAGRTFTTAADAASYAARLDGGAAGGVYHRLTTLRPIERGRGTAADSAYLPGFAMDLDLRGPGHKSDRYPETAAELDALLRKAGLPEPTVWVHSGGGRYPYWLLEQPVDLTLPGALADAARISRTLHETVMAWAADAGWKVDNTSDLARIYRLPGTHNRKSGAAVLAHVLGEPGARYALGDLLADAVRPPEIDPGPDSPPRVREERQEGAPAPGASSLFGGGQGEVARASFAYTLAGAMQFVAPALDRLRSAQDGEINNRLNDAAMALAHFGEQFWSREAAEKQLYSALANTEYDGATWQAGDTIASAYRATAARGADGDAECWSAELLPEWTAEPSGVVHPDDVSALLAEMLTADDLAARKPPRFMIEDLLQFDSEAWVIGEPGSKKSFVVLDMAAHVATGRPWQGKRVNPALVVFIVAEGAGGSAARVRAWQQEHGGMGEHIRFLPRPVQSADLAAWAVLVQACAQLAAVAREQDRGMLVVLDTQARVTVGLKENDATDMGVFVNALSAIRAVTGACVLPIHHTGRRGGDARGSSAIDGAQTTELKVVKVRDMYGKLIVEKQKDIAEIDPIKIKFKAVDLGQDDDGKAVSSLVLVPAGAWNAAEIDDETFERADAEEAKRITPFAARPDVETWTHQLAPGQAKVQRWALQTLADVGGDRGLTEAKWRELVGGKAGTLRKGAKVRRVEADVWGDVFRWATDPGSPAGAVVIRGETSDRWTVDPVALTGLKGKTD